MTTDQRPTIPAAAPTPAPTVHPDTTAHPTPRRRLPLWLLVTLGAVALIASVLVAVTIGPADLDVAQVLAILGHHLGLASAPTEPLSDAIVWELRLPRVLTAACVGAGLALGGAVMQSLTRNPLADPYLLGLSSGASLGAVAVLVLGVAILLPVAAFAGALAALALTLALARTAGALTPTRAVLAVSRSPSWRPPAPASSSSGRPAAIPTRRSSPG